MGRPYNILEHDDKTARFVASGESVFGIGYLLVLQ
jgi:hypothetical protein